MSGQPKRALLNRRRRNPIRCGRRFVMQCSKKRPGCRQDRQIPPRAGRRDGPSRGKRPGAKTVSKQNLVTKRLVDPTPATVRSRFENFLRLRTRPKAAATAFHRRVERRPTDRRPSAPGHSSGGGGAVFRTRASTGAGPSCRRLAGIPRQGSSRRMENSVLYRRPPGIAALRNRAKRKGTGRPAGKQRFREKQPPRCEPGP